MANKIQIKRSVANAVVSGLSNGELAFTQASNTLWIGLPDGGGVLSIGGARTPGVLTANQALVANATSAIDKVIVANLVPTGVWANGAGGSAGQLLASNGAGGVYWAQQSATGVTSVATGDGLTGGPITSTGTVSVLANNGIVANSTGVFVNTAYIATLSANNATYLNGQLAAFYTNATNITTGTLPYAQIPANIVNTTAGFALGGQITFNANVTIANSAAVLANGSVGTAGFSLHSNGTGVYWAADDQGVTSVASGNGLIGGTITSTGTLYVLANSGIVSNTTGVFARAANGISVDASGINVVAGNSQLISNSTGIWANQANFNHNALTNYVADQHVAHTGVTLTAGAGLTGGGDISASRTFAVGAGNGILVNADDVAVNANSGLISNAFGVFVNANSGLLANSTGVFVVAGTGVVSNATGVHIGQAVGTGSFVTFANVVTTDLTVSGNLIVTGTTTTVNSQNLLVRDNMIGLADTQNDTTTFVDVVDSGFFISTGNTLNSFYSGIARIAGSSTNTNPLMRVFATSTLPNSTVLTGLSTGTMQAFLAPWGAGGAFVVNTTAMAFNANTTVSLAIAANSLSLSTALPTTSGGTGFNTYASGDLLVGNTGNSLSKLSIGADGTVLQVSGTSVVFQTLDGGTF
jgi:hypothetical protein